MATSYIADTDTNGVVISYCPFGCDGPQIDDYGHCKHLIGFTTDKQHYEPLAPLIRKGREGPFDTGMKIVTTDMANARQLKVQPLIPQDLEKNHVVIFSPRGKQRLTQKERGEGFKEEYDRWQTYRVYQQYPPKAAKEPELVGAK